MIAGSFGNGLDLLNFQVQSCRFLRRDGVDPICQRIGKYQDLVGGGQKFKYHLLSLRSHSCLLTGSSCFDADSGPSDMSCHSVVYFFWPSSSAGFDVHMCDIAHKQKFKMCADDSNTSADRPDISAR
jgi:hypothetical protein